MRFVADIIKVLIGVLAGAAIVGISGINLRVLQSPAASRDVEMSYAELAAINLTAATIALGAVAVVVTIAAVFGFQVIRAASVSAAESRVEGDLQNLLQKELGRMERDGSLTRALERAIYSGNEPSKDDASPAE